MSTTSSKVPIVAIVGRANVGKSSLFNAFLGRREAIVFDEPGTTRDSLFGKITLDDKHAFWIVDTAGLKDAVDEFEFTIQEQISQAADSADIILVVVEAETAVTEDDRRVATMALKTKKPVILLINKADRGRKVEVEEYKKLGIKPIIPTSAIHKTGFDQIESQLIKLLPPARLNEDDNRIRLALLGRPNVGKSSLFNTLAKKQQAVVADRAGTTRDVNRTTVKYKNREIELLDTAGIRRSGKIGNYGVERFSVIRALAAIEESDICLLLIDANEYSVALDQKIAGLIKEAGKGLVLVVSKWDTVEKDAFTHDQLTPRIAQDFTFVPWAPLIFTSSETGQNVSKIFDLTLEIMERRAQRLKTTELNKWLRKVVERHPPAGLKNRQPKLRYMTQETDNPIPAFKIFGSQTKFLHWSYRRHMDRMFRETWDYTGTPVQFWFIENREDKPKPDGIDWKRRLRPDQLPNRTGKNLKPEN